jgi:AraC-like DNA-binding protein
MPNLIALSEPLQRFPVVQTREPEEMRHALISTYGARHFATSDNSAFSARANYAKFESIGIGFCAYGKGRTVVDFPEGDFARIQFGLKGTSATTIEGRKVLVDSEQACVTSPGRAAKIAFEPDYEQIIVRIETSALRHALTSILGAQSKVGPEFDAELNLNHPLAANFRRLVFAFAQQLDECAAELPRILLKQIEQSITLNFLYATRHSLNELLEQREGDASVRHIQRVEEYIEAHWDQPLNVEILATVANIGVRALFRTFQQTRGYSPKAFAKSIRLKKAKEILSSGSQETSVTAVAFRCGFSNLGHFANDYRNMFGELPSCTIEKARKAL